VSAKAPPLGGQAQGRLSRKDTREIKQTGHSPGGIFWGQTSLQLQVYQRQQNAASSGVRREGISSDHRSRNLRKYFQLVAVFSPMARLSSLPQHTARNMKWRDRSWKSLGTSLSNYFLLPIES